MFVTHGSLLGRDPSGTRSVLAWIVCGAWSTSSRLFQQMLLQHSTMHTTAASVGQQDTHRPRTHTYTHVHAHIHTHMHMHAHVARVMGFANFQRR